MAFVTLRLHRNTCLATLLALAGIATAQQPSPANAPSATPAAATSSSAAPSTAPVPPTPATTEPPAPAEAPTTAAETAPLPPPAAARDNLVFDAREAFDKRDATRLEALRVRAAAQSHALLPWIDYWSLTSRLGTATSDEVQAFISRWPGRYVEDRLRNDWLLELGRRRDWTAFTAEHPRFRMNDDREVACYALAAQQATKPSSADPKVVEAKMAETKAAALEAWLAQTAADDGCISLARTLADAKVFDRHDLWSKVREAVAGNRLPAARQAAYLLGSDIADTVADVVARPLRHLERKAASRFDAVDAQGLDAIALAKLASNDPDHAARMLQARQKQLSPRLEAWVWAQIARQAGFRVLPTAPQYTREWFTRFAKLPKAQQDASEDTLAWATRNALRSNEPSRWAMVDRTIGLMRPAQASDSAWRYWRARARIEDAASGPKGDEQRAEGRHGLQDLAGQPHAYANYYGMLAAEDLGEQFRLPAAPTVPTATEAAAARNHPGLTSALTLIGLGLRDEGNREWNYSLRGMGERELLAASQLACDREVWDRCINTSERTRDAVDLAQRYPVPFRQPLLGRSQAQGVDPALTYGVVRQESRFVAYTRSSAGAGGLMQLMPRTARWTAGKLGITDYAPERMYEPELNAALGTGYLKMVLDEFGGSQALATAAYNAGPHRARRWREGTTLDAAAWVETIPFNETRDYVKRVLSNAVVYSQRLGLDATSLKQRLGPTIGPPTPATPTRGDLP